MDRKSLQPSFKYTINCFIHKSPQRYIHYSYEREIWCDHTQVTGESYRERDTKRDGKR